MVNVNIDSVKKIFGYQDKTPSELILQVSIFYPCLTMKDIFKVYKTACDVYHTQDDYIEKIPFSIRKPCNFQNWKMNYHSTFIFRNLHRIIDETNQWDRQLKKECCLRMFKAYLDKISIRLKSVKYRDNSLLDLFDITSEFIELIQKKKIK